MRKVLASLITAMIVSGCATDATVRPQASDLAGSYYSGDGLGRNVTVVLNSNGTFASDWQGCLGLYGEAEGTWRLDGERITFIPGRESEFLSGYLRQATTIRHSGRLGFVRPQDLEGEKVDESLVFYRQESQH